MGNLPTATIRRRLTTVMAADVCGYTRLVECDEGVTIDAVNRLFELFLEIVVRDGGRVFHRAGDGFFAEFPSAVGAASAALSILKELNINSILAAKGEALKIRIGLHVGEISEQSNGDLMGHGVNVASRLQLEADAGSILASESVINLIKDSGAISYHHRGVIKLRNIIQPIATYHVMPPDHEESAIWLMLKRFLKLRARILIGILLSAIAFLLNAYLVNNLFRQTHPQDAPNTRKVVVAEIDEGVVSRLTEHLDTPARSDSIQVEAAQDAMRSLAFSPIPEKRTAVELIEKNRDLTGASAILESLYSAQTSNNVQLDHRIRTLKEWGAVVFYSDTKKALEVYLKLDILEPQNPVTYNQLGKLHFRNRDMDQSLEYFVRITRSPYSNDRMRTAARIGIARVNLFTNKLNNAEMHLLAAMKIAQERGFIIEEAVAVAKLGALYTLPGKVDPKRAEIYYQRSFTLQESMQDKAGMAEALDMIGQTKFMRQQFADAVHYHSEAIEIDKEIQNKSGIVAGLTNLGYANFHLKKYAVSEQSYLEALKLSTEENMVTQIPRQQVRLGEVYAAQKNFEKACEYLSKVSEFIQTAKLKGIPIQEETIEEISNLTNSVDCYEISTPYR